MRGYIYRDLGYGVEGQLSTCNAGTEWGCLQFLTTLGHTAHLIWGTVDSMG